MTRDDLKTVRTTKHLVAHYMDFLCAKHPQKERYHLYPGGIHYNFLYQASNSSTDLTANVGVWDIGMFVRYTAIFLPPPTYCIRTSYEASTHIYVTKAKTKCKYEGHLVVSIKNMEKNVHLWQTPTTYTQVVSLAAAYISLRPST